jgi:hypothetical protein
MRTMLAARLHKYGGAEAISSSAGSLTVHVKEAFTLPQVAVALRQLETESPLGRVVLKLVPQ